MTNEQGPNDFWGRIAKLLHDLFQDDRFWIVLVFSFGLLFILGVIAEYVDPAILRETIRELR